MIDEKVVSFLLLLLFSFFSNVVPLFVNSHSLRDHWPMVKAARFFERAVVYDQENGTVDRC
jgi:hypothetical protein